MTPTRKYRSVNKRFSSSNEVSSEKDGVNSNKYKQRKKKLSDKLGSQWSKEELERFYEAYRKYGKDWKKVTAVVHNRSIEMVEALYNMNRAYLSLPEGTASVVGLIAMMTDHYNVLEGSGSERESNGASRSRKPLKRKHDKIQLSISKDSVQSQSIASSDGCLSLLKKRCLDGTQPRAVGKRTPRVPVYYSHKKDDRESYERSLKSTIDACDDDFAHGAALALAKAAQRGTSLHVSQTPYRRREPKSNHVPSRERVHQISETACATFRCASLDENFLEGSIESRGAENWEACSGTEEGSSFSSLKEKVDIEVTNAKPEQFSLKRPRKSSKQLFTEDEIPALDALQTLADLSLMMPASTIESESSIHLKGERMTVGKDDKAALPEATSTSHYRYGVKLPGSKVSEIDVSTSKKSKHRKKLANDTNVLSKSKEQLSSADKTLTKKRKSGISKAREEEDKPVIKGNPTGQVLTLPKQLKMVRSSESSLCSDQKDLTASTVEVPRSSEVCLPSKRSRRKMILRRTFMPKEKSSENILESQPNTYAILKEILSSCLSSFMVRRWFTFEWFYSAIDYPWFAKREFMEYLNHVGLGNIPRLTRVEWSVIKSSLGKPRRFSEHFLREERQKLQQYRESVRKHYTELQTGIRDGLPTDLAIPLYVGQRVIALHPKTREIHDGSVLTVDHEKCRIQFDSPELGVEFVMDIDCMPLNPLDNMPESLRRQISSRKVSFTSKEPQISGYTSFGGSTMHASPLKVHASPLKGDVNHGVSQAKVASNDKLCALQTVCAQPHAVHHQAKEADIRALSELKHALDKKESLLMELNFLNNYLLENQNEIESSKDFEAFQKHYARVLVELSKVSEKVSSAMLHLRQRNTYPGNSLPPMAKPQASFSVHNDLQSTLESSLAQELGSIVIEITKGSRLRAHAIVDAAYQALSLTKEGEDAFSRVWRALDSIDYQKLPLIRSQEQLNGNIDHRDRSTSCASEPLLNDTSGPKVHNYSDKVDAKNPAELITSCVATLIMIQSCTERQYPPADVAQILDSAVTSLHPCCPQNLPIYREIQMCMGRIKTQILALIPT